ncbi:MAG: tetratricopeptide repeat protein, partial [Bacteroidota bacterium]
PSTESYRESYQCFVNATHGQIGDAWYYIGRMYDYGEGMKANPVKAFQCYLVAARDGNSRAQYSLGFMYETGYGCKKLPTEAYVWYAIAAQNGLTNARQTQLGLEKKLSSTEIQFAQNRLRTLQAYLQSYKEERPNRHIPFE